MTYTYQHAILGGTFDHFHIGHEKFVAASFPLAREVTIGLVKHPITKLWPISIESYENRIINLKSYLQKLGVSSRANIIPLHDIFGTSLTDSTIDAIYVTESTHANAILINNKRSQLGLPILSIIIIPYEIGDDQKIVSSSRIREGLIDHTGHSYLKYLLQKPIYNLPASLRECLQKPLGTVVTKTQDIAQIIPADSTIISVGDIVSIDLQKAGYPPTICIVDYQTRQTAINPDTIHQYFPTTHATLSNPAGSINSQFAPIFLSAMSKEHRPQIIAVSGEEDLLALPAMLLAPLDSFVIYGQYKVGMCIVQITEDIKLLAKHYLDQFT